MPSYREVGNKESTQVVIYPKWWKIGAYALAALVLLVVGVWEVLHREIFGLPNWVVVVVAYIGVPFFGLCLIYYVFRLVRPQPVLLISERGLFDNASATGIGFIRWEQIEEMLNKPLGFAPINIPEALLPMPLEKLIGLMAQMYVAARGQASQEGTPTDSLT